MELSFDDAMPRWEFLYVQGRKKSRCGDGGKFGQQIAHSLPMFDCVQAWRSRPVPFAGRIYLACSVTAVFPQVVRTNGQSWSALLPLSWQIMFFFEPLRVTAGSRYEWCTTFNVGKEKNLF